MTYLKLIITAALILLIAIAILFACLFFAERTRSERWLNNYHNIGEMFSQIKLSQKELKRGNSELLDSINSKNFIQLTHKEFISYDYSSTYYTGDTLIYQLDTVINGVFPFEYNDSCITISGHYDPETHSIFFDAPYYHGETSETHYRKKPKIFPNSEHINWKKFWKPYEYGKEVHSSCTDSLINQSIQMIRR